MIKSILVKGDCHLNSNEEPILAYRLTKKFAKDFQPDMIVDIGDFMDLPYISIFNKHNLKVLSHNQFKKDFDFANKELDDWQSYCKEYIQIEGNHEYRLVRLIEKEPFWEGFVELENALRLKERKIPFYPMDGDPLRIGKLVFVHGYWYGKYAAQRHLDAYAHNVVFGHGHQFGEASKVLPIHRQEMMAWEIGCLTDTQPEWLKGKPSGWQRGFAVVYMETMTGKFNLYQVHIIDDYFVWNGKIYKEH